MGPAGEDGSGGHAEGAAGEARRWPVKDVADVGRLLPSKGTIDFEAYMPYRGTREGSEWLEFQNLTVSGRIFTEPFNIKTQRGVLWSGCSGIGLERWTIAFLSQKGLDPKGWPDEFKGYLPQLPRGFRLL